MDEARARAILAWRYDGPYSLYNPNPAEAEKDLQVLTDPANRYYAATDERGALIAYYCFGEDARVAGGDYSDEALDIGGGVRPDLTGRGMGSAIIRAGISFGQRNFSPDAFRATVAAFNLRALRVCEKTGFSPVHTFSRADDKREFVILLRRG